jgi:hypothetical protein
MQVIVALCDWSAQWYNSFFLFLINCVSFFSLRLVLVDDVIFSVSNELCIYNNIAYLYRQYSISIMMIFCHTNFTYHSDVCYSVSMFYINS